MFGKRDARVSGLARVKAFSACSRSELETLARLSDEVRLRTGTILMREGTSGRECFVIVHGEAVVRIGGREIARVGPGDIVGEIALLDRRPRSATVVATEPLTAIVMTALQFATVAERCPAVARRVMGTLARRLREVQAA